MRRIKLSAFCALCALFAATAVITGCGRRVAAAADDPVPGDTPAVRSPAPAGSTRPPAEPELSDGLSNILTRLREVRRRIADNVRKDPGAPPSAPDRSSPRAPDTAPGEDGEDREDGKNVDRSRDPIGEIRDLVDESMKQSIIDRLLSVLDEFVDSVVEAYVRRRTRDSAEQRAVGRHGREPVEIEDE